MDLLKYNVSETGIRDQIIREYLAHLPLRPERGTFPRLSIENEKVVEKDRISLKRPDESTFHPNP